MTTATIPMRKLTISVSEDFYEGLLRSAGPRKIGAFIEKNLESKVATKKNLDAGYKAMAADQEREKEAKEWVAIAGETLPNETW